MKPTLIQIGNKKYAKSSKDLVESLFHAGGTADGIYKIDRDRKTKLAKGIWLKRANGDVFAYIKRGATCFAVACSRQEDGRIRYAYGCGSHCEQEIGIDALSLMKQDSLFQSIFEELDSNID